VTAIASFYGSVSPCAQQLRTELGHWARTENQPPLDLRLNAAGHLILCTHCDLYVLLVMSKLPGRRVYRSAICLSAPPP